MNARSAVLSIASVLLLAGCGSHADRQPPADATKLVPRGALVYVHLSTDVSRPATKAALAIARRFSGFDRLRASVLERLSAPGCRVPTGNGKEAALALLDAGSGVAGSLVIVDSGDDKPAKDRTCGAVRVAKLGRFTVIGQPATVAQARALSHGKGRSLADDPGYRGALRTLPASRVADAWVTRDGVRRLLEPQNGALGIAGALLDRPDLKAVAAAVAADGAHRAHVVATSLLTGSAGAMFAPRLQRDVPAGVMAYLGTRGLAGVTARLLTQVPGGIDTAALKRIFPGEVGLALSYAVPAPVLTILARTGDPAAARRALARIGLRTATVRGLVVASTRASGIAAVRTAKQRLPDSAAWRAVHPNTPNRVGSLVFLDFSQLLRLAEQTGLGTNRGYLAVKSDLQRVRTAGATSQGAGHQTTAELLLSIP